MRIKKKSIGENLKKTEDELNAIKGMVYQTSDELRNMGIPDDESKEIATKVVTKSYVDSNDEDSMNEVDSVADTSGTDIDLRMQVKILSDALNYYLDKNNHEMVKELRFDIKELNREIFNRGMTVSELSESARPKMTKDELTESVKRNTTKKKKVIKTISVKNLRNE
jgi:hypothetical protein